MFSGILPLTLDGATGTELQKRGMPAGACTELWILEHPDAILDVQRRYIAAGTGLIFAPTFGANRAALSPHGAADRVEEINLSLVELAREAVGENDVLIAGDLSPTGLQLEPYGETTMDELIDIYAQQAAALDRAGVDLFGIETSIYIGEARAALLGIRRVSKKPVIASFTLGPTGRSIYGGELLAAFITMQAMGVSAFGINCCADIDLICDQTRLLARHAHIPLLAKPNAGLPEYIEGRAHYSLGADQMRSWAERMHAAGARLIGGCCGTDAEHIRAIDEVISALDAELPTCSAAEYCATETRAFPRPESFTALSCGEDLADDADDAEDDGAQGILLRISDEDALDCFLEACHSLTLPVALDAASPELMEAALISYNGRAVLAADSALDAAFTEKMAALYGLML